MNPEQAFSCIYGEGDHNDDDDDDDDDYDDDDDDDDDDHQCGKAELGVVA